MPFLHRDKFNRISKEIQGKTVLFKDAISKNTNDSHINVLNEAICLGSPEIWNNWLFAFSEGSVTISKILFTDLDLSGFIFSFCNFDTCEFKNVELVNTSFSDSTFKNTIFRNCNVKGLTLGLFPKISSDHTLIERLIKKELLIKNESEDLTVSPTILFSNCNLSESHIYHSQIDDVYVYMDKEDEEKRIKSTKFQEMPIGSKEEIVERRSVELEFFDTEFFSLLHLFVGPLGILQQYFKYIKVAEYFNSDLLYEIKGALYFLKNKLIITNELKSEYYQEWGANAVDEYRNVRYINEIRSIKAMMLRLEKLMFNNLKILKMHNYKSKGCDIHLKNATPIYEFIDQTESIISWFENSNFNRNQSLFPIKDLIILLDGFSNWIKYVQNKQRENNFIQIPKATKRIYKKVTKFEVDIGQEIDQLIQNIENQ